MHITGCHDKCVSTFLIRIGYFDAGLDCEHCWLAILAERITAIMHDRIVIISEAKRLRLQLLVKLRRLTFIKNASVLSSIKVNKVEISHRPQCFGNRPSSNCLCQVWLVRVESRGHADTREQLFPCTCSRLAAQTHPGFRCQPYQPIEQINWIVD